MEIRRKTVRQACNSRSMMEAEKLDALLTQVNCRITRIARSRQSRPHGWLGPMKDIPKACRSYAAVCSRLAVEAGPDGRSGQFAALAQTWLELATELEISGALLGACSIVSDRNLEQELKQAIKLRAQIMQQIDCEILCFEA